MAPCSRWRDEFGDRCAVERAAAREDLVEHEAERVDVAARRDLRAGELLGRHVGRRAGADRLRRLVPARPKSVMRTLPGRIEHDVGRLEIAMDDAALVGGREARRRAGARSRSRGPRESARCGAAARPGPRRPRTPSRGTCGRRARRCRTRGTRWGARPAAPCALRREAASGARGRWSTSGGRNLSATGWPSFRSSAR